MRRGIVLGTLAGVLAVTTVLWWLFLVGPRDREAAGILDQLQTAQDREQGLRTELARLRDAEDREVSYLFAIGEMERSIPETAELDAFLESVNTLADETGVELQGIDAAEPAAPEGEGAPFEIDVSLSLEGRYFEVLGFLYGVEAMERLVRVDGLSITPVETVAAAESTSPPDAAAATGAPGETLLQVELDARLFTRTELPPAGPAPGAGPPGSGAGGRDGGSGGGTSG